MEASKDTGQKLSRRNYLTKTATGAALLAAGTLSLPVGADEGKHESGEGILYGHGMVWNRDLPGVAGELRLGFDLRVDQKTGMGLGTAEDPVYPDSNLHFAINSAKSEKRPGGETRFAMIGVVTKANNPANVGLPVKILAETSGDATAVAIAIGEQAFAGAGLVVIALNTALAKLLLCILMGC